MNNYNRNEAHSRALKPIGRGKDEDEYAALTIDGWKRKKATRSSSLRQETPDIDQASKDNFDEWEDAYMVMQNVHSLLLAELEKLAKSDQMYDDPQVDMSNWNIAENLLEETRYMISYVSHGNLAQDQANKRTSTRDDDDDSSTLSITAAGGEIFQSSMTGYLREQIKSHFKENLFGIVSNLQKRGKGKSDAVELIKHVCVVFKLII
ncbi:hypothetical protein Tco_1319362 [Tanacetum coccineum]